ncbi:TlpA disulfide reductase family protein [Neptunitalea lumnitzerae]|uniref:Thioredoxin domain-containing protein n=1 Tax=Neptunitalea lumnitzerae TaxID=2965509 RepID=A0ABQ5MND9_9FLAO|nr:TlpA disulfide reductase family protein [Neptunitalea sp. Y10]GLB50923.1 hypothetical protein Y10_32910 [Neptunitalea sp. Y10]
MIKKIRSITFLMLLTLGAFSCDSKPEHKEKDNKTASEITETKPEESTDLPKLINSGDKEIRVMNFSELQKEVLSVNDDKTYVINFWATWCGPCVKELPHFEELNAKYAVDNVEVILVSLDFPNKVETQLLPFLAKKDIQSKVVFLNDTHMNEWIPKVSKDWSGAIPATLIYNKDKRAFYEQSFTFLELEETVKNYF